MSESETTEEPDLIDEIEARLAKGKEEPAPEEGRARQVTMHNCTECGLLHASDGMTARAAHVEGQLAGLRERNEKLEKALANFEARLDAALAEARRWKEEEKAKRVRTRAQRQRKAHRTMMQAKVTSREPESPIAIVRKLVAKGETPKRGKSRGPLSKTDQKGRKAGNKRPKA